MAALLEHPLSVLKNYIPAGACEDIFKLLQQYKVHLKIKRDRKTFIGDYRPAHNGKPHTISMNASLNEYHFLITLVHELAHLVTHLQFGRKVLPHGSEWKKVYAQLLHSFMEKDIFPENLNKVLQQSTQNVTASTCSDPVLYKTLLAFDEVTNKMVVEDLMPGSFFKNDQGMIFQVLKKVRTRYTCVLLSTKQKYLFPAMMEVHPVEI